MSIDVADRVGAWVSHEGQEFSKGSFEKLLRNEIPFVFIEDFATIKECEALVSSAIKEGFGSYRDVEPRIDRIGNTVFEFDKLSQDAYFEQNIGAIAVQERIFGTSFDPIQRLLDVLSLTTGRNANVARDSSNRRYYSGLVRRIERGTLLHIDYAPVEQKRNWEVTKITQQLSWNLYLRASPEGHGKTHIYDRQWQPQDNAYPEGSYGFSRTVVRGANKVSFTPKAGLAVIFNTRNFHFVDEVTDDRIAVSTAIGLKDNGDLILWS